MPHRKDVTNDLNHDQHVELVNKIKDFLNEEIIHEHMAIVGSPGDPAGMRFGIITNTAFWNQHDLHENLWHGHRYYISKLEDFLMKNGGEKFVLLPPSPHPLSHKHHSIKQDWGFYSLDNPLWRCLEARLLSAVGRTTHADPHNTTKTLADLHGHLVLFGVL